MLPRLQHWQKPRIDSWLQILAYPEAAFIGIARTVLSLSGNWSIIGSGNLRGLWPIAWKR